MPGMTWHRDKSAFSIPNTYLQATICLSRDQTAVSNAFCLSASTLACHPRSKMPFAISAALPVSITSVLIYTSPPKPLFLWTKGSKLRFVHKTVLRQISCCQVKQVWKILIQRSRSEARPYILLLIYFILLFRPSISPLLIEYFMAFLIGEMSRWTLFTKLTTSP